MSLERETPAPVPQIPEQTTLPIGFRGWLRSIGLEVALLGLAACGLAWAVVGTIRVGRDVNSHEDLRFAGTTRELSTLLAAGRRDRLATLEPARFQLGDTTIVVEIVRLLADPSREPAVARGGFIADQAALFNDHSIRRAVLEFAAGSSDHSGPDRGGPSLLQTVRDEAGNRRISDRPSAFAMTVRSPYAEHEWTDVRTSDWRETGGLIGLEGNVGLGPDLPDETPVRLNGCDCTVRRRGDRFLLYCRSTMASDARMFYDIGFERDDQSALGVSRAFRERPRAIWRNGTRVGLGDASVRAGDLFDGEDGTFWPFLLSVHEQGALASRQWINGRETFANERLGTMSFFASAGRSKVAGMLQGPITLSIDAMLSHDLEAITRQFMQEQPSLSRMSVVVLDVRSGQLRAVVEPARSSDREPLLAFSPHLVGSVVKPIVASAILVLQPELADMNLRRAGDVVEHVADVNLREGFANPRNGCDDMISFDDFLCFSSNQYAAELLLQSLRRDGFDPRRSSGFVPQDVLTESALGDGLALAFEANADAARPVERNGEMWREVVVARADEPNPIGNPTLLPLESRPWILNAGTQGTSVDYLARFAFGGWEHRWTLVDIAKAYARIATGRAVQLTIAERPPERPMAPPAVAAAFRRVRAPLRRVSLDGTAAGLAGRLLAPLPTGNVVFAKTGTLNEDTDKFKALALAVGTPANSDPSAPLSCGLVAVLYFEFADDAFRGARRRTLPSIHTDFAGGPFAEVLGRHWARLTGCPDGGD